MTRLLVAALVAVLLFGVSTAETTSRAYLPTVHREQQAQPAQPRGAYDLRPPDGLRCFHSDVTVVPASDGSVWWNALCQNGEGQNVFRTDASGTRRMFRASNGGRGFLFVGHGGFLYIAAGSFEADPPFTRVEAVPEWIP